MALTALIVLVAILSTVASQAPFDPEEMLFIYSRCMEDHLPTDDTRKSTFLRWKDWNVAKDDDKLPCYVKCVLDKTGLYDSSTGKFSEEVIKKQWEKYQSDLPDIKSSVDAYATAVGSISSLSDKNDCAVVSKAYLAVFSEHKEAMRKLFHGDRELTAKIYKKGEIRNKNQSYLEFCENKFYPSDSDRTELCTIRKYEIVDSDNFKKLTECNFKGFRYITKDGQLNRDEIKRDFEQVGSKKTAKLDEVLNQCPESGDNLATRYYKCLISSGEISQDFKEAFDYREIRSRDYGYNLAEKRAYNKEAVQSEVSQIDSDLKCKD